MRSHLSRAKNRNHRESLQEASDLPHMRFAIYHVRIYHEIWCGQTTAT
jgi:hypothetical protein